MDKARLMKGNKKTANEILKVINRGAGRSAAPLSIDAVRRFLRGKTHKQGGIEQRGRKPTLGRRAVLALNSTRKQLINKCKGKHEVHWKDVIKKTRVPKVHRSTAKRAFDREGLDVEWRRPREKPSRGPEHVKERFDMCREWKDKPVSYFKGMDMIIDNKRWDFPTTDKARTYVRSLRVRGHLRTPGEGLKPNFTKPSRKKNRMYCPVVSLCAGIANNKVVLWTYLPKTWNGEAAAALFKGPVLKALKQNNPTKTRFRIIEDNDPTGYNSKKAIAAKTESHITSVGLPRYSPDLNPLDFFLWSEVERRMAKHPEKPNETMAGFKARLRRTAMNIPSSVIGKAVASMKKRAKAIFDAKGHDIARD
jgi:hypothetical protein